MAPLNKALERLLVILKSCSGLAVSSLLIACTVGPFYSTTTSYPGEGAGIIEKSSVVASAPLTEDTRIVAVPVGKGFVPIPVSGSVVRHTGRVVYEIRSADGTLHILSTPELFERGTCVAWKGFADGPSRTHWSMGRVQVERIRCDAISQ
jgi:hypothetical protein